MEDHAVLENQGLGELLQGEGQGRNCHSSQGATPTACQWLFGAPSPAEPEPGSPDPPSWPTGLDVSSRETLREMSPGKLASGKARPSTWKSVL